MEASNKRARMCTVKGFLKELRNGNIDVFDALEFAPLVETVLNEPEEVQRVVLSDIWSNTDEWMKKYESD